jgi:hypothetical protein
MSVQLAKRMHAGLVIECQEIAILRQKIPLPGTDENDQRTLAVISFTVSLP